MRLSIELILLTYKQNNYEDLVTSKAKKVVI